MADTFSKEKRSDIMRRVKSFNTKPELALRHRLHKLGFRFTLHQKKLPGTPDIVLPKYRAVINVHGCFWHGHQNCKRSILPESNKEYWLNKIERNTLRDRTNNQKLSSIDWNVITVFECELRASRIEHTIENVIAALIKH
ncbi:very short patch repair endonuclease [Mucilaginibacter sp.]|jgi:DNA mismatch endonuclease (patch repair protein)|uniref:very short patch repair endonuclease n=1 Tax=Mucilaginibacter sp. TaxID=1882438 RepID=UPI002B8DA66C|nr:very short patch repair endonuclease [Mucilaginibacter sp.]HTI60391.1 very short patch repair endonuclease [Mucilaginibacter sp.]